MLDNEFTRAGNSIWWYTLGACLIIGGIFLLWTVFQNRKEAREDEQARLHEIDQHLAELYRITDDLREREANRARREIRARERRADREKQRRENEGPFLTSLTEDQVKFMQAVTEGINEL